MAFRKRGYKEKSRDVHKCNQKQKKTWDINNNLNFVNSKDKKKDRSLSVWGWTWVDKMGTEDETQMERSGQNLMINSPYFFFMLEFEIYMNF